MNPLRVTLLFVGLFLFLHGSFHDMPGVAVMGIWMIALPAVLGVGMNSRRRHDPEGELRSRWYADRDTEIERLTAPSDDQPVAQTLDLNVQRFLDAATDEDGLTDWLWFERALDLTAEVVTHIIPIEGTNDEATFVGRQRPDCECASCRAKYGRPFEEVTP